MYAMGMLCGSLWDDGMLKEGDAALAALRRLLEGRYALVSPEGFSALQMAKHQAVLSECVLGDGEEPDGDESDDGEKPDDGDKPDPAGPAAPVFDAPGPFAAVADVFGRGESGDSVRHRVGDSEIWAPRGLQVVVENILFYMNDRAL
jgi:hypothetical protein